MKPVKPVKCAQNIGATTRDNQAWFGLADAGKWPVTVERVLCRQPKFYHSTPGQMGALCWRQRRHSSRYKSANQKNYSQIHDFKVEKQQSAALRPNSDF